jgi:tetratricopeptide (TPR) repeat protein
MTPSRSRQAAFLLLLLFLLLLGIGADHAAPPPRIPLEVEYTGCKAVLLPGSICVPGKKRELRLWIGAPAEARIKIRVGGAPSDAVGKPVQDGQQFSVEVLPAVENVEVLVEAAQGRASWSLAVTESAAETSRDLRSEVHDKLSLLYDDIQDRRLVAARQRLSALRIPPKAPAESHYERSYYAGLLAEKEGDYRTALTQIQEAVQIAERVSLDHSRWLAEEELALLLCRLGRFREAAQLFESLAQAPQDKDSCEKAQFLSNQAWAALLAREAGESFEDPTRILEKALKTYETCEKFTPEKGANVLINLALAHLQERRLAQAKAQLIQVHELEPAPSIPHQLWQLDLEARTALREGQPERALDGFADLDGLALATGSADGRLRAALGKAQAQEDLRDRTAALETLSGAEALLDEQSLQIPIHEGRETFMATRQAVVSLHVELLVEQGLPAQALAVARHGRSRMLRQLERGNRLANLTPDQRARWEALLADYQEKRAALEEQAKDDWRLLGDQRDHERAARKATAEAMKGLLDQAFLILGVPGEPSGEELVAPGPGELILAYYPLSHDWARFVADGKSVVVSRFELPQDIRSLPPEEQARLLLADPLRASIKRAQRIRILPSGPLLGVDFHALPFDGDVLLARIPVVYGLDLPVSARPAQVPGRHALLVADPRDNLPGALTEARTAGRILSSSSPPWITEELKSTEASVAAVRRGLDHADLLHYAGHGVFSGFGGWESGLLLAEETQLTLGDLLALDRVPAWVVLSGCETGRSSAETPVESLGLAQAFLLAGSRAVVASTRPADDREMPAFFTDLYQRWDRETDLAVALQRAQLSWRQRNPEADWRAFRLFVP